MYQINKRIWILPLAFLLFFASCQLNRAAKGGAIGAAAGGILGGIITAKSDRTAVGVIVGAAIGGAAGALIGHYMDKQAREMEKELANAEVERIEEGILLTMGNNLLFGFDSDKLNSASKQDLKELAGILQKYKDTEIRLEGHTDNIGNPKYNQALSERRAKAVYIELANNNVDLTRMKIKGYGEQQPRADNAAEEGRQMNRRVEVAIFANEELKDKARQGSIKDLSQSKEK